MAGSWDSGSGTWQSSVTLDFSSDSATQAIMDAPGTGKELVIENMWIAVLTKGTAGTDLYITQGASSTIAALEVSTIKQGNMNFGSSSNLAPSARNYGRAAFNLAANATLTATTSATGPVVQITATGYVVP